jgi:hypothetical protein
MFQVPFFPKSDPSQFSSLMQRRLQACKWRGELAATTWNFTAARDALPTRLPESKVSFHFTSWDAGFACVSFDRGVQIAQILQVFDSPAEALYRGMKLADRGTVRLALFGGSIHMLLFDALQRA